MNIITWISRLFRGNRRRRTAYACLFLFIAYLLDISIHSLKLQVPKSPAPLDWPFSEDCTPQYDETSAGFPTFNPDSDSAIPGDVTKPRENATILILARNKELDDTLSSIQSLEDRWNKWYHYPYTFLNNEPWDPAFESAVREATESEVTFAEIPEPMWSWPENIDQALARQNWASMAREGLPHVKQESYHHMCRFYSGFFYDHPALEGYKYFWRVEPNVEFTCQIPYDPFRAMRLAGKIYGYTIALWEVGGTCPSLFRQTSDYKEENSILGTSLWKSMVGASWAPWPIRAFFLSKFISHRTAEGDAWNHCHFWSNFEIADLDFFRSREYRDYFKMLDEAGGFYYERWGDAAVHSLALGLFAKPEQVHWFEDIGYMHPPFTHCPAEGVGCRCECDREDEVDGTCVAKLREGIV